MSIKQERVKTIIVRTLRMRWCSWLAVPITHSVSPMLLIAATSLFALWEWTSQ
jgi:hypothetical protein